MKYCTSHKNNSIMVVCWLYIIIPYDCPQVASKSNTFENFQIRLLDTLLFETLKHAR